MQRACNKASMQEAQFFQEDRKSSAASISTVNTRFEAAVTVLSSGAQPPDYEHTVGSHRRVV